MTLPETVRKAVGFQSTLPVRGGTLAGATRLFNAVISIHPPRAGRDGLDARCPVPVIDFNPPSPCGEGRIASLT